MPLRIESFILILYIDVQSGIALIQFAHCFSEAYPLYKLKTEVCVGDAPEPVRERTRAVSDWATGATCTGCHSIYTTVDSVAYRSAWARRTGGGRREAPRSLP